MPVTAPVVNGEGLMEDSLRHLHKLGFTDYEARAYVALLRDHPSTRYQLSQNASIPQSKVYEVVRRLQDKGVIAGVQGRPPRFVPLSPDDLLAQLESRTQESLEYLRQTFPRLADEPAAQWIWNIEGYDGIITKTKELLDEAEQEIVAALWQHELKPLHGHLQAAHRRGVELKLLAYDDWEVDFGIVKQHGFEEAISGALRAAEPRILAVVVDRNRVLVGSALDQAPAGVWSNHGALAIIVHRYVLEHFYAK